jgi:phosphoglycerol transferase MdoB-like AlkP superfamily enzyme
MENQNYQPMTIGDWIVTFIITYIPIVGIVMLFVWAFSDGNHPSKKTWAQATLILFAIAIVLGIIFATLIVTMIGNMFGAMGSYS